MFTTRILMIMLEFPNWELGRPWSYVSHFGIEDGLRENGVETVVLPAIAGISPSSSKSWLRHAEQLCQHESFDQVWVWLVHTALDDQILAWIQAIAPIRVGLIPESLNHSQEELELYPQFKNRKALALQQVKSFTHILACDEEDVAYINSKELAKAAWWTTMIPERFLNENPTPPKFNKAVFYGSLYSKQRENFVANESLRKVMANPRSLEADTEWPRVFNELQEKVGRYFENAKLGTWKDLGNYVDILRNIRTHIFQQWLQELGQWGAIVNLPTIGKCYASRVFEAMSVGRPCITWKVPGRPRNHALFKENKDILFFDPRSPESLLVQIRKLQRDPELARFIGENAMEKVRVFHTAEVRIEQILQWIQTGQEPRYSEQESEEVVGKGERGEPMSDHMSLYHNHRKSSVPLISDENRLLRSSDNKEGLVKMSHEQVNQRNQEEQFYTDLFVRSGTWSTPNPNTDESMRWGKIQGFLPEIIRRLHQANSQPVRILDVGSGRGWLTNLLSDYGYCEGIEPVETVVEYGRKLFPHLTLHVGFPETLLTRDDFHPYDLIVTSEVIEHIPHAQKSKFIHTLQELLKINGVVILTTPRGEVWDQWRTVSTPNQPIEDWITEPDLLDLFRERGFHELGRERIYFDLPKFQYVPAPLKEEPASSSIIALYQVWAFGTGALFQDLYDPKSEHSHDASFEQPLSWENASISVHEHTPSLVLSQNSEKSYQVQNPLVSVIVPSFNRRNTLQIALQSIIKQTFTDYEIIVINDAGVDVEDIVTSLNTRNNVTSIRHGRNRGLAAARNSGLGVARGKYIAYLDDDDRFLPRHLEILVASLEGCSCQVAYSDAWRVWQIKENGQYAEKKRDVPYSQDFNPDMLLLSNYFPVLCMMHEKACLNKTGVFDETLTTHEDWDLWIRMSRYFVFAHVKEATAEFTWRTDGSSMTSRLSDDFLQTKRLIYKKYDEYFRQQPYLIPARDQELRDLENRAKSQHFECSIIIPVFNKVELTQQCLMHLAEVTTGISYEVVMVDNNSIDGTSDFLETLGGDVQIIRNATNLGFAKACNQGARAARGEHLLFLNNDTIPMPGWLDPLLHEIDSHDDVADVGSKLLYQDNTIQHAGVVISRCYWTPYHLFMGAPESLPAVNIRREFQAVTAACMLVRKEIFEELGGFDEGFVNGFEDVDLCLKIREMGKKVIYQPKSCLYHLESQTAGRKTHDVANVKRLLARWEHKWLVDEDLAAFQCGYIIQQSAYEEKLQSWLTPLAEVAHLSLWQRVVELQQLLLGRECQPLAEMADSQKIRDLLVDVEAWPDDIGILEWMGRVCESLDCEKEAVQFWEKLLLCGDHPHARLSLARSTLKNGNLDEAQKHLDVLKRNFHSREEGLTLQGILFMQRQNYSEAKQAFEQSLAIDGANRKAQIGLGMACMGLAQTEEAWDIFEQVVSVDPDNIDAIRCLIQAGTVLQRWELLASHLAQFVERNPADCDIRFALAGVQFRAGYSEKAKEHLTWLRLMKPELEGLEDLEGLLQTSQAPELVASIH